MKKVLYTMLAILVTVTSLSLASVTGANVVNAEEASTDTASADGVGILTAKGDGIAFLSGRGVVDLKGHGLLWIKDHAGNASIEVRGYGKKKRFNDGWIQYAGFRGRAEVKGSNITVVVAGTDIELRARGRGRAILWGHGRYKINNVSAEWNTGFGKHIRLAPSNDS